MRLIDPNVLYLVLLFGLWASVTAAYMPGTGLLEIIAVGMLAAALYVLTLRPTNWLAVAAIVGGVLGCLTVPLFRRQWSAGPLVGIGLQVVGSLFLFNGLWLSPLIIGLTAVVSLALYRMVLIPALHTQDQPPEIDDERLLPGQSGSVVKALNPVGTVNVRGELWTAYASDGALDVGTPIRVLEVEGLRLRVERHKIKRMPTTQEEMANE